MRKFLFLILIFSFYVSLGQAPAKFEFFLSERSNKIPNTYNSAADLYMRDMGIDPPQKIDIKLTQKERDDILKKAESINFFDYPDIYKFESADSTKTATTNQPCLIINLSIFLDGKSKYVGWNNCHDGVPSKNNMSENLEELRKMIDDFLFSKENYKKSKPPKPIQN